MSEFAFPTLVQNAALLLAVAVVFDALTARLTQLSGRLLELLAGLMLGIVGVSLMLTPWEFAPDVFFDTRPVLLIMSGLFFGFVPTLVAGAVMIAFRIGGGGAVAWVGAVVIVFSGGLGLAWRLRMRRLEDQSLVALYLFGLGAHVLVMIVVAVGLSLALPVATASAALGAITVPVLAVYPVAVALLGSLLVNRLRRRRLALANAELQQQVADQLEEVRRSRARIVAAGDEERRRLERDIHDGAQQRLVALTLSLRLARSKLGPTGDPAVAEGLERASAEAKAALAELRELARGIHPQVLTQAGLAAAVQSLADRSPVPVTIEIDAERYAAPAEAAGYFVVSEALANVAKYAQATRASVRAERRNGELQIEIVDDGIGGADPEVGSGLRGLGDRLAAVGGRLSVESEPGQGTRLWAVIPIDPPAGIEG